MHARQLAEIGGWIACSSEALIRGEEIQPTHCVGQYWSVSKCRLQRWNAALKVFHDDLHKPSEMHDPWPAIRVVVEEVLLSEMLTRVWTAALSEHDRNRGSSDLQCVAHSVFVGHLEARDRSLRWLLDPPSVTGAEVVVQLNQFRRRMERWTDLLLSLIAPPRRAAAFGFDRQRVMDFAADRQLASGQEQHILLASLAACLQREASRFPANPDLNRRVAGAILRCFPNSRFDSVGLPKAAWMLKLEQVHDDTQLRLNQLIDQQVSAAECIGSRTIG